MSTKTNKVYNRIESEMQALFGVAVTNLVMAALVMAFGISIGISQILPALEAGNWVIIPFVAFLGLVAGSIGIWWIISTAGVLESVSNVQDQFKSIESRESVTDIELTQIIVQLMATYRLKRPTIKKMMKVSYWGGILFVFVCIIQALDLFVQYINGIDMIELIAGIVGLTVIFSMSAAFFFFHKKYQSYSRVYDKRILKNKESEKALKESMGGLE